jgi:hypothetical protein
MYVCMYVCMYICSMYVCMYKQEVNGTVILPPLVFRECCHSVLRCNLTLTLNSEFDSFADRRRNSVAGDAKVGTDVSTADGVDCQRVSVDRMN